MCSTPKSNCKEHYFSVVMQKHDFFLGGGGECTSTRKNEKKILNHVSKTHNVMFFPFRLAIYLLYAYFMEKTIINYNKIIQPAANHNQIGTCNPVMLYQLNFL
jgi:hypothetical protein